ncbi:MAG: Tat pathway signal protein [Halalkalicoccus sp.]
MALPDRDARSRREYLKGLVALGGVGALSACLDAADDVEIPTGDPHDRPDRQHAWNAVLSGDDGNVVPARHHVLLSLSLAADPTEADRERFERALEGLERAYEWSHEGLLVTVGYTPRYFDRFGSATDPDLPEPTALTGFEDPDFEDRDLLIHLASDHSRAVLGAEEALLGGMGEVNGVRVEESIDGLVASRERLTGFVGAGLPAEHGETPGVPDAGQVPENAPFFMGFRSGFDRSQATEDRVTIEGGPFAGGTTQHVETLSIDLRQWYDQDSRFQRVAKTFSHEHAERELVGEYGEKLEGSNALTDERIASTIEDARRHGVVGHAQKAARAREDGEPLLLRRDFNTTDGDRPGLHFLSVQRSIDEFVHVRDAMTGRDVADESGVGPLLNNGLLQYVTVRRRGNYLLPPREKRAFPGA